VYPYCHREYIEDTIVVVLGQMLVLESLPVIVDNKIVVECLDVFDENDGRQFAERQFAERQFAERQFAERQFACDTYIIKNTYVYYIFNERHYSVFIALSSNT
jgi:hypothetical protein